LAASVVLLALLRLDISETKATERRTEETAQCPPPVRFADEGFGDRIEPLRIHDQILHPSWRVATAFIVVLSPLSLGARNADAGRRARVARSTMPSGRLAEQAHTTRLTHAFGKCVDCVGARRCLESTATGALRCHDPPVSSRASRCMASRLKNSMPTASAISSGSGASRQT